MGMPHAYIYEILGVGFLRIIFSRILSVHALIKIRHFTVKLK